MNISPDASQTPFSQHLSGEVTGRMQGSTLTGLSNASPEDPLQELKKAHSTSSGTGPSKISGALRSVPSDVKKPSPPEDKTANEDDGDDEEKVEGEFNTDVAKMKEEDDEDDDGKEGEEDDDDDEAQEKAKGADDGSSAAPGRSDAGKAEVKKRRSRKKWKKPKDKPNRPLSAYNLFFRKERALMLGDDLEKTEPEKGKKRVHRKTHGKIGFAQMARIIGAKWKTLPEEEKSEFEEVAGKEKKRYSEELTSWKDEQKKKAALERKNSKANKGKDSATAGDGDDETGLDSMSKKQQEALKMQMMQGMSRGNLPFFGGESQQRQMPTIEYLRAMQDDRASSSLFRGGRPGMGNNFNNNNNNNNNHYPNAAEASASALLQQFQTNPGMMPPAAFAAAAAAAGMDVSGRNDMERLQQLQMARMQMMNSSMMGGPMGGAMNMGGPMGGAMNMGASMVGGHMGTGFPQMGTNQQSQQLELERLQQQMFFQNKMAAGMNNQMMGGSFGGLNNNSSNSNNNNINDMSQVGGGGSSNNNMEATMRRFQNRYNGNM